MKKYQVLPLIILCLFLGITKTVQAEGKGEEKTWSSPGNIKSLAPSDTNLLSMDMYYSYIIAAAVQKDPDNVSVQGTFEGDLTPLINFYYNSLGNLDYVITTGINVAQVYYCDGTETYACPKGWLDYITFSEYYTTPAFDLDFFYTSDTPSSNYYAQATDETILYFYNINMADGYSVSVGDALYLEDSGYTTPHIVADLPLPYTSGQPNWSLWFNTYDGLRLSIMDNFDHTATATFTASTSNSVYRFWSNAKQHHFFTISKSEKNSIIPNDSSWSYEGIAYKSYATQLIGTTAVYRFWSNSKQGHFFTASAAEKNSIIANDHSWAYEGIAYYAYATDQANTTAVYRFWSNAKQGHFFTTSVAEKNSIIADDPSWAYEGIAWYVPTS